MPGELPPCGLSSYTRITLAAGRRAKCLTDEDVARGGAANRSTIPPSLRRPSRRDHTYARRIAVVKTLSARSPLVVDQIHVVRAEVEHDAGVEDASVVGPDAQVVW
jgi:hypothetical protein